MILFFVDLFDLVRVVVFLMYSCFCGVDIREVFLFQGLEGWVEFLLFVEYDDVEVVMWLVVVIDFVWCEQLMLLCEWIGVNVMVLVIDVVQVLELLLWFVGCCMVKVKVVEFGQMFVDDVVWVCVVCEVMGFEGWIWVDVNGLWNVDEVEYVVYVFGEYDFEYVEQLCVMVFELVDLCWWVKYMGIFVVVDESVWKFLDFFVVVCVGVVDFFVVKVQLLGGIMYVLQIVIVVGLLVVVLSVLDMVVGLLQGVVLVVVFLMLDYDCGFGMVLLFFDDVVDLCFVDGVILVGCLILDVDVFIWFVVFDE